MSQNNTTQEKPKFDTRDYIPVLLLSHVFNKRMLHAVGHRVVGHSAYRTFIEASSDVFNQQVDRFGLPKPASMASGISAFVNEQVYGSSIDVTKLDFYTYVYRFIYLRQAVEKIKTRTDEFVELLQISLAANGIVVDAFDKTVEIKGATQVAQQLQHFANQLAVQNKIKATVIHFSRLIYNDNPELWKVTEKVNKHKNKLNKASPAQLERPEEESAGDETYAISASIADKLPDFAGQEALAIAE